MTHLHLLLIATILLSPFSISESQAMEQPLEGKVIIIATTIFKIRHLIV